MLKLEHKQLNKKSRHTFVKEWEDSFDVILNPGFGVKILYRFREEYDQEEGRLPKREDCQHEFSHWTTIYGYRDFNLNQLLANNR